MKVVIIYLFVFFSITTNAQYFSLIDKSHELSEELLQLEKEKNYQLYKELRQLKTQVKTLIEDVKTLKSQQTTNIDIKSILDLLDITPVKEEDLPNNLQKDEIGVAFVEDNNGVIHIGVSFQHEWKIIKL